MTIKEFTTNIKRSDLPPLDLSLILAYVIKKSREFVLANPDYLIKPSQLVHLNRLIKLRKKNYPIAYLTNEKEFYGFNFFVNENVLVPRPETELMIEETVKYVTHNAERATLVDVGTGSGCIIITLAKLLESQKSKACPRPRPGVPSYKFIGLDVSLSALQVAKKNAKLHKISKRIKFIKSNLLQKLSTFNFQLSTSSLIILANLPYLTPKQVKESPSIKREPRLALVAGKDGLKYYRELFRQIKEYEIKKYHVLCEIDHTQTEAFKKLIKKELPGCEFYIKKDLSGYARLGIIKSPK
ncbi:MAG: Release factor glutamine methyltransferase [Parcubacteria group bacterium GW2011_GWE2_38_18]|nr:MAG: Release factor glutamine methyltransferase [Parcubacteria group bacterium GW2011_GWE2_38_18]